MTNDQNSKCLQEAGIEVLKDNLTATAQSGTFLNFGERMAVSDFTGSFMFRAITTNVSNLYCILYDANGNQIHFPCLHSSLVNMGRVCETDAVVKKITVYGNCIDPSQPSTVTLLKVSNLLLESFAHTRPVFTTGSCHANILIKELYISEDIWPLLESEDKKLMLYHVHNEDHPTHRSLVFVSEYLSGHTDPYANRFVAYDISSDVLVLAGSGHFAGKYCYMVVDWDSAWKLFEEDGLINSGEVILQAVINQEAASNLTLSPTIASYLEKNPQVAAPSTQFGTVRDSVINENIAEPALPVSTATAAQTENIFVNTQDNLAGLNESIATAIGQNKKCINVVFGGGTYYFSEGLLDITSGTLTNVELNLIGNGCTLIGSPVELALSGYKDGYFVFNGVSNINVFQSVLVNDSGEFVSDFYGQFHEMPKLVEFTTNANANNDLEDTNVWKTDLQGETPAKMRVPNTIGPALTAYCENTNNILYIQIYLDYFSQVFLVTACTQKYIIVSPAIVDGFYDSTEANKRNIFSGGSLKPCFRLINYPGENSVAYVSGGKLHSKQRNVRLCSTTNFLTIDRSIKALNISGFKFKGNCSGAANDDALISISNATAGWVNISDCEFENIRSQAVTVMDSSNISIQRNKFKHYYKSGVSCKGNTGCRNVHVLFNECRDGNLRHYNDGAITCQNSGAHIAYNKLVDYGYQGIAVGKWRDSGGTLIEETAIIEYNELYMTPDYRNRHSCVPLLDGGAIYTWTRNHRAIIRYNFINGHSGAMENRGIFCDDGTFGVWIYGNLIINTKNYYDVDLWRRNSNPNSTSDNVLLFNIIGGYYRFEGTDAQSLHTTNTKGCNVILNERNATQQYNRVSNIDSGCMEDDRVVVGCKIEEQGVALPANMKNWLSAMDLPEFIMSHIRYTYL